MDHLEVTAGVDMEAYSHCNDNVVVFNDCRFSKSGVAIGIDLGSYRDSGSAPVQPVRVGFGVVGQVNKRGKGDEGDEEEMVVGSGSGVVLGDGSWGRD
jgi:hypothetical protein